MSSVRMGLSVRAPLAVSARTWSHPAAAKALIWSWASWSVVEILAYPYDVIFAAFLKSVISLGLATCKPLNHKGCQNLVLE